MTGVVRPTGIRIGFQVGGAEVPRWQALAIERLLATPGVEPALLLPAPVGPHAGTQPLLYRRWTGMAGREAALRPTRLPAEVLSLPRATDTAGTRDLDVLLSFSDRPPPARAGSARYGSWWFAFGPRGTRGGLVPGTWELVHGERITEGALVQVGASEHEGITLRRGAVRTDATSPGGTAERLLNRMAEWPSQVCRALLAGEPVSSGPAPLAGESDPLPGRTALLRVLLSMTLQPAKRMLHTLARHDHWNVGLVRAPIASFLQSSPQAPIEWLPPPATGRFIADPFGVHRDGRVTVVCEEFEYARGTGRLVTFDWPRPGKATPVPVGTSAHRSYPYLLEAEGAIWCIPETHQSREIVLHRAEEFPNRWRREQVLVRDVAAVDSTLFEHEGHWWLAFGDRDLAEEENLFLWYAPELRGPWRPHPANPVKTDPRSSRPAGTPFRYDGRLYRPAQDCSSLYGRRVAINHVRLLTPHRFDEEPVAWVEPDPAGRWPAGLHTLSAVGNWTLIDSKRVGFSLAAALTNLGAMAAKRGRRWSRQ